MTSKSPHFLRVSYVDPYQAPFVLRHFITLLGGLAFVLSGMVLIFVCSSIGEIISLAYIPFIAYVGITFLADIFLTFMVKLKPSRWCDESTLLTFHGMTLSELDEYMLFKTRIRLVSFVAFTFSIFISLCMAGNPFIISIGTYVATILVGNIILLFSRTKKPILYIHPMRICLTTLSTHEMIARNKALGLPIGLR